MRRSRARVAADADGATPGVADDEAGAAALERRLRSRARGRAQRTIRRSVVVNGQGLHSGVRTGLDPAAAAAGKRHRLRQHLHAATIPARIEYVDSTGYATTLFHNGIVAKTVEHLLAALHGYRITNLLVKMQGEIPILDGSASSSAR